MVDLVFSDVLAMKIRSHYRQLTIADAGRRAELEDLFDVPEQLDAKYHRLLVSDGEHEGFILCGAFQIRRE